MNQGTACLNHFEIVHRLPGRVRIELAGLRGAKSLAAQLAGRISGLKGVNLVQTNPYTGRLLISYDRVSYSEKEIIDLARECWQEVQEVLAAPVSKSHADVSGEQGNLLCNESKINSDFLHDIANIAKPLSGTAHQDKIPYRRQLYNTIMVTGVVGFLGIKNLIWGVSPLAGSVGLFNIASAVTIISGYPLLRRGLHTLTSGGPVNTDLVMGSVGLVTSVLRESMLGLLVTWMGNVTSLVNAVVREEFKKQELNAENRFEEEKVNKAVDEATGCEQGVSIQDEADSEGAVEHTYPENVANTYLGLSALTGVTSGDWHKSMSMILASCPGSSEMIAPMALAGTDVTKEASTIIITDDNFTTVVASIEQGRGIYDNIRKTVRYLLATNVGEVVLMSLTVMSGMPLALLPIQLLFLNLLGDGFPAVALGLDRPAPDVMDQSPRSPNGKFFDRDFSNKILSRGISIGVAGLGSYIWGLRSGGLPLARTVTLASLTISQLLHALDCRWDRKVNGRAAGNKYLTGAVGLSALLLAGSIYLPAARTIFKTQTLGLLDWTVVGLGAGLSSVLDRTFGALLNVFRPGAREEREVVQTIREKELTAASAKDLKLLPASVR